MIRVFRQESGEIWCGSIGRGFLLASGLRSGAMISLDRNWDDRLWIMEKVQGAYAESQVGIQTRTSSIHERMVTYGKLGTVPRRLGRDGCKILGRWLHRYRSKKVMRIDLCERLRRWAEQRLLPADSRARAYSCARGGGH
eukprot:4081548-Pleurochrysis_carterae.AAC.1